MIENRSILSELAEAVGEILSAAGGMVVVAIIFGFLIAPVFGAIVESSLTHKNGVVATLPELLVIERKMRYVNAILWVIAIASWVLLFALNLKF